MALFDTILKKIFYNSCLKYRRIAQELILNNPVDGASIVVVVCVSVDGVAMLCALQMMNSYTCISNKQYL